MAGVLVRLLFHRFRRWRLQPNIVFLLFITGNNRDIIWKNEQRYQSEIPDLAPNM